MAVIPADARFGGVMDSRDAIIVAGLPIAEAFFRALDPAMEIEILATEGAEVAAGSDVMRLSGNARAMLTAERSALNTVQHLSGIATMTRRYVDALAGTGATLLDTRKTIPGLRGAGEICDADGRRDQPPDGIVGRGDDQGQSCRGRRIGRGSGARAVAAGIERIIVEVDRVAQVEPALAAGATHLLLDNMTLEELRECVAPRRWQGADRGVGRGAARHDRRDRRDRGGLCIGGAVDAVGARGGCRA